MMHKHRIISYLLIAAILMVTWLLAAQLPLVQKFTNPLFVRDYLLSLGSGGYLIFLFIVALSIPLPLPSSAIVLGGGYVYGFYWGTLLAIAGTLLGGLLAFYIVRIFGEPLLEKLVDRHHIIHFNHLFNKYGTKIALISYAVPIFPGDALSLILGLSKIHPGTFILLLILGNIPRSLIINSLGHDLYAGFSGSTLLVLIFCTLFLLTALFREKVKLFIFKELRYLEAEGEKAERFLKKEAGKEEEKREIKKKSNQKE